MRESFYHLDDYLSANETGSLHEPILSREGTILVSYLNLGDKDLRVTTVPLATGTFRNFHDEVSLDKAVFLRSRSMLTLEGALHESHEASLVEARNGHLQEEA